LRLFSFGGYGLALAALALVVFGAHDSYPIKTFKSGVENLKIGKIGIHPSSSSYFILAKIKLYFLR